MSIEKTKKMFRFTDRRREAAYAEGRMEAASFWWQIRIILKARILYQTGAK